MSDPATKSAIFDELHCIHCGSVNPAEWIATRKGDKEAVPLALSAPAAAFLEEPSLVKVARVGEPPKKQVVPGPRTSDAGKAARCCVDWAIKEYGAVATGQITVTSYDLHGYQQDFLQTMAASQGLATPAAALESLVSRAMGDAKAKAAIFDELHCIHCGSVNPAEWIATRKGKKESTVLPLSTAAASFLEQPMLAKVRCISTLSCCTRCDAYVYPSRESAHA